MYVDFTYPESGFDRVTYGIRNLPVAAVISVSNTHGAEYPICGDTLGRS